MQLVKNQKNFYSTIRRDNQDVIKLWLDNYLFPTNFDLFRNRLYYSGKIKVNDIYSVLIKIRIGDVYRTLGDKQECFTFDSIDAKSFGILFEYINNKLEHMSEYPSDNSIDYNDYDSVLLEFFRVYVADDLKISNLGNLKSKMNKTDFDNVKRVFNYFGDSLLDIKGKPLTFYLTDSTLDIKGLKEMDDFNDFEVLFFEKIKSKHKDYILDNNSKLYLIILNNKNYVVILNKISDIEVDKFCFNKYAQLITKCKDTIQSNGNLCRDTGLLVNVFNSNNELIMSEKKISLTPFKGEFKRNLDDAIPNLNIGVLDIETYEDQGIAKCFAIGFYTSLDVNCKTFYINEDLDSDKLLNRCFTEMFRHKYKDITFYVHNLGRYDGIFIPKSLSILNRDIINNKDKYKIEAVTRNGDILRLVIKKVVEGKLRTIKLQDSFAVLSKSLRDLCKDYKTEVSKGLWPYTFCRKDTLFYIGKTPDIKYYEDIKIEEYIGLYKEIWSLQQECIRYLEKDLLSLHEVLIKVCKSLHFLFNLQMVDYITVSSMSVSLFLNKYYNISKRPLPLINSKTIFDDIHKAYYGGRVEVFKPIPKEGDLYYDVNSLYPFASLFPLPGINCVKTEYHLNKPILFDIFGFFYCKIKTSNNYIGLLPKRNEKGDLCFPLGEWEGWYFSEELKFAADNGYEIQVLRGYNFDKVYNVFDEFVNDVYKVKSNPRNGTEKNVAKLILNSLIGKFGMNLYKSVTKLVDNDQHDILNTTRVVKDSKKIDDNLYLTCYIPSINKEICDKFDVDYVKALNSEKYDEFKDVKTYKTVSITTAAAVLSYARIHMAKVMLFILKNGGTISYHDTDSLVTDLKLPSEWVDQKDLGKFKLEYTIKKGFFTADKTYYIESMEGKIVKRAKNVKSKYLEYQDYEKLYNDGVLTNAVKISSVKNIKLGSVIIKKDNNIKLDTTVYKKRDRIFENGKWIDSKPIHIIEKNKI